MKPVVIVDPPRADPAVVDELGELGVATVHEAAGKTGLLGTALRPAWPGARAAGTALTVLCGPGDNLMLHVAIEQARPGDLLVVTTTSPSSDGFAGELITTSLAARGVRGLVTTTGVRDVAPITAARFPVWSQFVSAQGTGKAIAGAVNTPVSVAGTVIRPGDAVVADDDGVVCIPREQAAQVAADGRRRAEREDEARDAFMRGELGLDRYQLRPVLERLGVTYIRADHAAAGGPRGGVSVADDGAVLDALRDAILAGEFAAGQRLVEVDLCERFGCSRFAVRAAIPVLASEGLVDVQRHRGARVRVIPLTEAIEITEVRRLLEGLTAARAAERVTPEQAAELEDIVAQMRVAVESAELLRYSDTNARLHARIRAIAAHDTATSMIERLRAQLVRHQFALALIPGRPAVSLAQHERIVAAIAARDPAAAEAAMRDHITSVIDSLSSLAGERARQESASHPSSRR